MVKEVLLQLSNDEALVLFEWIKQFNNRKNNVFDDEAEKRVLWDIEAELERVLVLPFDVDYKILLSQARSRVRDKN